ncbi:MAG: hypothetical protein GX579_02380 [Chloroflexi bacterium]|nr:hypothetical protein [Chloroflexota bacterium]
MSVDEHQVEEVLRKLESLNLTDDEYVRLFREFGVEYDVDRPGRLAVGSALRKIVDGERLGSFKIALSTIARNERVRHLPPSVALDIDEADYFLTNLNIEEIRRVSPQLSKAASEMTAEVEQLRRVQTDNQADVSRDQYDRLKRYIDEILLDAQQKVEHCVGQLNTHRTGLAITGLTSATALVITNVSGQAGPWTILLAVIILVILTVITLLLHAISDKLQRLGEGIGDRRLDMMSPIDKS